MFAINCCGEIGIVVFQNAVGTAQHNKFNQPLLATEKEKEVTIKKFRIDL